MNIRPYRGCLGYQGIKQKDSNWVLHATKINNIMVMIETYHENTKDDDEGDKKLLSS